MVKRQLQDVIRTVFSNNVLYLATGVKLAGPAYSQGTTIVLSYFRDTFCFGKIYCILLLGDIPYIVYEKLITHFNSYEMVEEGVYGKCQVCEMLDFYPLGMYKTDKLLAYSFKISVISFLTTLFCN